MGSLWFEARLLFGQVLAGCVVVCVGLIVVVSSGAAAQALEDKTAQPTDLTPGDTPLPTAPLTKTPSTTAVNKAAVSSVPIDSSDQSSDIATTSSVSSSGSSPEDGTEASSGASTATTVAGALPSVETESGESAQGSEAGLNLVDGSDETSTSTSTTADPLINEEPRDTEPLDPNITVPPPAYDHTIFRPAPVLWSSVNEAEEKLAELRLQRRELIATMRSLRKREKELEQSRLALGQGSGQAVEDFNNAAGRLRQRAVVGYVELSSGNSADLDFAFDLTAIPEVIEQQRKNRFLEASLAVDRETMDDFVALRQRLDAESVDLVEHGRAVTIALRSAERNTDELSAKVDQALIEAEAFRAGSEIYVDGVVFPIAGNYSTPLIDSFGFPRMPGTADAHWHEGIDIFAPRGTPLVAAERGIVVRIGNGRLGGLKFWLRGESGADWYYAHLDSFAPGLHNGQVVQAGELLGYVGNTGNAISTPPHLHLEIHPGGGRAVNPYPLLRIVSDLELDAIAAGAHPGFRYQARIVSRGVPTDGTTTSSTDSTISETTSTPETETDPAKDRPTTTTPVTQDTDSSSSTIASTNESRGSTSTAGDSSATSSASITESSTSPSTTKASTSSSSTTNPATDGNRETATTAGAPSP